MVDELTPSPISRRRAALRVLLALVVIIVGSIVVARYGSELDLDAARSRLRESGPLGITAFVLAFAVLQPLHVSGHLFALTAVLVWGAVEAFFFTWIGSALSAVFAFVFARYMAHDWVQTKLPDRLRNLDARIDEAAFKTVLMMRALLWGTPALGFALGTSRVSGRTHHLASAIGVIPPVAMSIGIASGLSEAVERGDIHPLALVGGVVVTLSVLLGLFLLARRLIQRRRARRLSLSGER